MRWRWSQRKRLRSIKDFTPITMIANSPYVLVLYSGVPAKDVKELALAKTSRRAQLRFAGPQTSHILPARCATLSDVELTHIPYKSSAQSVIDLISGRLDMQFATIAPTLSNIRAGQLRALAVTGRTRVDALPEVPTMIEAGVAGYEATLWFALMAPAGTPAAIATRLNREAVDILNSADMKETLALQGFIPDPGTPDALTDQIAAISKWKGHTEGASSRVTGHVRYPRQRSSPPDRSPVPRIASLTLCSSAATRASATPRSPDGRPGAAVAGQSSTAGAGSGRGSPGPQAVHDTRHQDVGEHRSMPVSFSTRALPGRSPPLHRVADLLEIGPADFRHLAVVLDQKHVPLCCSATSVLDCAIRRRHSCAADGVMTVPRPTVLVTVVVPPDCLAKPHTWLSPNPVRHLCGEDGSNMRQHVGRDAAAGPPHG